MGKMEGKEIGTVYAILLLLLFVQNSTKGEEKGCTGKFKILGGHGECQVLKLPEVMTI